MYIMNALHFFRHISNKVKMPLQLQLPKQREQIECYSFKGELVDHVLSAGKVRNLLSPWLNCAIQELLVSLTQVNDILVLAKKDVKLTNQLIN